MAAYRELSAAEREQYEAALRVSHRVRTVVNVYDRDETFVRRLGGKVVAGQVDVDGRNDISRSLSLTVADPSNRFLFESMGEVYADNFIGVEYGVYVPDMADWVHVPVFFGPVSRYARNGHEVTVEAVGKEALMLPPVKKVALDESPAGRSLRAYIHQLAGNFGEDKFCLGEGRTAKVPSKNEVDPALGNPC